MWASEPQVPGGGRRDEAHVQARTSVLNLVVVARRPEMGERAAATISRLSGRHPSRTIILSPADPDGPRWIDAQVQAVCMVPADGGHETCAELVYLTAGGEAGRHLDALVAPLLIHDLPVATWWPGDTAVQQPPDLRHDRHVGPVHRRRVDVERQRPRPPRARRRRSAGRELDGLRLRA